MTTTLAAEIVAKHFQKVHTVYAESQTEWEWTKRNQNHNKIEKERGIKTETNEWEKENINKCF